MFLANRWFKFQLFGVGTWVTARWHADVRSVSLSETEVKQWSLQQSPGNPKTPTGSSSHFSPAWIPSPRFQVPRLPSSHPRTALWISKANWKFSILVCPSLLDRHAESPSRYCCGGYRNFVGFIWKLSIYLYIDLYSIVYTYCTHWLVNMPTYIFLFIYLSTVSIWWWLVMIMIQ